MYEKEGIVLSRDFAFTVTDSLPQTFSYREQIFSNRSITRNRSHKICVATHAYKSYLMHCGPAFMVLFWDSSETSYKIGSSVGLYLPSTDRLSRREM